MSCLLLTTNKNWTNYYIHKKKEEKGTIATRTHEYTIEFKNGVNATEARSALRLLG